MNCPHCNSPSADGKKYCADCGTPLDAQTKYLETFVKSQVEEAIQQKFKDQKLVDIETSQAIAERVHGWAKLFGFFVGLPIALLLIVLAVSGIEKYRDFKGLVEQAQNQVKLKLEQAKGEIEQAGTKAANAKASADEALKTTDTVTAQVNGELNSAKKITKNVEDLSNKVSESEKRTSSQMSESTQRIESQVQELHKQMDAASKDIIEQQKKIASTDELVKAMFSKGVTEFFQTKINTDTVVVIPHKSGAFVYMMLRAAPIYQTTELKWRVYSQSRGSFGLINNVMFTNWVDPVETLRGFPFEVSYVPDPTVKVQPYKVLSVKDGKVFADGAAVGVVPTNQ